MKLRMIWLAPERRIKEGFAAWLFDLLTRFNRNENSIKSGKLLGIVYSKGPPSIRLAIHVEQPKIDRLIVLGARPAPHMKCTGLFHPGLAIKIISVKD